MIPNIPCVAMLHFCRFPFTSLPSFPHSLPEPASPGWGPWWWWEDLVAFSFICCLFRSSGGIPQTSVPLSGSVSLGLGSSPHPLGSFCSTSSPSPKSGTFFLPLRRFLGPPATELLLLEAEDTEEGVWPLLLSLLVDSW